MDRHPRTQIKGRAGKTWRDAVGLPFADGAFDGAAAVSPTGCLGAPEDVPGEIRRVLRQGGPAVVTLTTRVSRLHKIQHALNRFRRRLPDGAYRRYTPSEVLFLFYNFAPVAGCRMISPPRTALCMERRTRPGRGCMWGRNFVITAGRR